MRFERCPLRDMPEIGICRMYPFHISFEGLETLILCRDEEDYDTFVKIICTCVFKFGAILLMYVVVSNHAHFTILARSLKNAEALSNEIKRRYSMYFQKKYGIGMSLQNTDSKPLYIDNDRYLRNAIAYDIRNAADNGSKDVIHYEWSGAEALFNMKSGSGSPLSGCGSGNRKVCELSKRERRRIMHTDDDLSKVGWLLDGKDRLVRDSLIDIQYVEKAFLNDKTYLLKVVGCLNEAEMYCKLVSNPRRKMNDDEFLREVNDISKRWFECDVRNLNMEKKTRIVKQAYFSLRTNVSQLSRTFEIDRETMSVLIEKLKKR